METFLSVVGILVLLVWAALWIAMSAALVACEPRRERAVDFSFLGECKAGQRRPVRQRGGW